MSLGAIYLLLTDNLLQSEKTNIPAETIVLRKLRASGQSWQLLSGELAELMMGYVLFSGTFCKKENWIDSRAVLTLSLTKLLENARVIDSLNFQSQV